MDIIRALCERYGARNVRSLCKHVRHIDGVYSLLAKTASDLFLEEIDKIIDESVGKKEEENNSSPAVAPKPKEKPYKINEIPPPPKKLEPIEVPIVKKKRGPGRPRKCENL